MRRLLSFLSLFIIGWGYVWATVPLTKSTFSDPANCTYSVPITVAQNALAYGNENSGYADLTQYSKLRITLESLAGNLNAVFDGVTVNLGNWSNYGVLDYNTNTLIYDLDKVKKAANGVAHLKYIKNTGDQVKITSIEMVMGYPYTWELTEWQSQCYDGWTNNGTSNWSNNIASNWAYTQYGGELVQGRLSGTGHGGNLVVRTVLPETQGLIFNIDHTNQSNRLIVDEGIYVAAGLNIYVTVPDVKYGHLVNVDLNSIGGQSENKTWSITCNGETLASGDGSNVGMQTVTIPQSVTNPTNLIITIHGSGGDDRLGIRKIEVLPALENVKFRYDVANYNDYNFKNNVSPSYGDWNNINGSATIPVEGVNETSNASLRVVFNTGNVAAACGVSSYSEVTTALLNEYFTVSSSNSDIIDVSGAYFGEVINTSGKFYINGVKFKKLCGTATLTLAYKGTDVIKPFSDVVTLTINGKDRKLVWLFQGSKSGATQSGKTAGCTWASKNIPQLYDGTNGVKFENRGNLTIEQFTNSYYTYQGADLNQVTLGALSNNNFYAAVAVDMDAYYQSLIDAYNANPTSENYYNLIGVRKIKSRTASDGTDQGGDIWWLNTEKFLGNETVGGSLRINNPTNSKNNIINTYLYDYPQADGLSFEEPGKNDVTSNSANATKYYDRKQVKVKYSVDDEVVFDPNQSDAQVTLENSGQDKIMQYRIFPDQSVSTAHGDSLTIYAELEGDATYNPVKIWTRVKLKKNNLPLGFQPKEGTVTEGEYVIPYVNIPDIKLRNFEKILVWVEDEDVATVEVSDPNNYEMIEVDGVMRKAYVLYKDGESDTQFLKVRNDDTQGMMVDAIYPKITGLKSNETTNIHLILQTYTFYESESTFKINVVHDNGPAFHWYINDDGSELYSMHLGRSKATYEMDSQDGNGNVIEYNTIKYGDDNGIVKTIKIFEGDYIYMPGIVGSANGNTEYSNSSQNGNRYYMYGINNGNVIMNYDQYYYGEGVPNYFISNTAPTADGTWTSVMNSSKTYTKYATPSDRKIPVNGTAKSTLDGDGYHAYIFKAYITGRDKRGDTLMVYGAKEGITYLYAEDPQTHKVCTPIKIQVLPRTSLNDESSSQNSQKQNALKDMSYPYTWDFQHMDMTLFEEDVEENGASYWEVHRENPRFYQANGFFNADWEDKNNSGDLRQRWYKDMSANGKYLPQFTGIMLNIAGMDWWDQKYNRFNVAKDGSCIYFQGGPHFIALPGFGIYNADADNAAYNSQHSYNRGSQLDFHGSATRTGQTSDNEELVNVEGTHDGTRFHDNVPGALHDHLNIIHDGFLSSNDYGWNSLPNKNSEEKLKNTKVKLVINAYHNYPTLDNVTPREQPNFSIGGKSMMPNGLSVNAINEEGAKVVLYQNPGYGADRVKGNTFVFDIDPYDPEFQDHIYICFDHNVYVNWIAISTEPREMRSDYEMFTYSYPKDIDMDKTNLVMNAVTKSELGEGNEVEFKAMYAKEYNSSKSELTVGDVPDIDDSSLKKFAANEGVLIYPTKTIGSIVEAKNLELPTDKVVGVSSYESKMDYRAIPGLVLQQKADKNVLRLKEITADGKYIYEDATYNHSYYYLPTYFIANAQNVSNYEDHKWKYNYTEKNASGQKVTVAYNEGVNRGAVPLINAGVSNIVGYNSNDEIPHNIKSNKLAQSTYKTLVYPDYYTNAQGGNVSETKFDGAQRWISLGLVNEYILRTLQFDQDNYDGAYKELNEYMKDEYNPDQFDNSTVVDERESGYTHSTGYYYFDLIGPKNVRFYRTNNKGNMQCRRAYLELTWEEYMVNTFGKDGVQNEDGGDSEGHGWTPTVTPHGVKANPVKIVFTSSNTDNDDIMVSEDGGFPDGIKEIEQTSSASDGAFYNLNGMRVKSPRSGIYIVNGKKVVVSK